ncbi:hypothetical protein EON65_35560 [archaeon]|nr:MAG: hypothetical protein EON65_35560 [archaeon]
MSQRLQSHRTELLQLNAQQQLTQREVEVNKLSLQEISSMYVLEQNNLQKIREKVVDSKQECATIEQHITVQKDVLRKEEHRFKNMKFIAQEEIQSLHQEVKNIQADILMKKQSIDELEAVRKRLDEDLDGKQREFYYSKQQISQQYNEEMQKLNQLKNDVKLTQLANEQVGSRQRQLEAELEKIQERIALENSQYEYAKTEHAKKVDSYENHRRQAEKQIKTLKETKLTLENDQILLQHSVEELRRQQYDLEKLKEQRSKQSEQDLSVVQSQVLTNQRLMKQLTVQYEQKQHELQLLHTECQSAENKLSDSRKTLKTQEASVFQNKELLKKLEYSVDSMQKDISILKKEHDTLYTESQYLRSQITGDTAQYDELKRRITALKNEEETINTHEGQVRVSLQNLRQQVQQLREEYDSIVNSKDRETYALKELQAQKLHLENEIARLKHILNGHKERVSHDYMRKDEVDSKVLQSVEEMHRLQKQVLELQQKISVYEEQQRNFQMQEQAHKNRLQKLSFETEAMKEYHQKEKLLFDKCREEYRELSLHNNRLKEELAYSEQELQSKKTLVEQSKLQNGHLQQQRDSLLTEMTSIKENAKRELMRIENLEDTYNTVDKRLLKLREELVKAEESVVQTKGASKEEQQRAMHYQDLMATSVSELKRLEEAIECARNKLADERQRAIHEIGMLDQAKRTARTELLRMDDTRRKLLQVTPPALSKGPQLQPTRGSGSVAQVNNVLTFEKTPMEIPFTIPRINMPSTEVLDFKTLNNSSGNITDDSVTESAPLSSLQQAVEQLRTKSASAVAQVQRKV